MRVAKRVPWLVILVVSLAAVAGAAEVPFANHVDIGTVGDPATIATADFDLDGDLDVVAAALSGNVIRLWQNNLPGAWSAYDLLAGFTEAISVAVGDFDADGWPDLVVCQRAGDGSVDWLENPDGAIGLAWTRHEIANDLDGGRAVHVADLDGDGDPDVVGASDGTMNALRWYRNGSYGSSWTSYNIYDEVTFEGPRYTVAVDMDSDGDLDVVAAAATEAEVAWFENDGSIASSTDWTKHSIGTGLTNVLWVQAVDFDADGDIDVMAPVYGAGEVRVFANDAGVFSSSSLTMDNWMDEPFSVAIADLNLDGRIDLAAIDYDTGTVSWWEGYGSYFVGGYEADWAVGPGGRSLIAADLDGDGDQDLLAALQTYDDVVWIENKRIHHRFMNNSWQYSGLADTVTGLGIGDLDGDGRLDVAATASNNTTAADVIVWSGSGWDTITDAETDLDYTEDLALADVNGDGRLDIVAVSSGEDTVGWWENTGSGYSRHDISTTADAAIAVDAGDINNDGDVDIVVAAYLDGAIYLYRNLGGAGTSWSTDSWTGHAGATAVRIEDIDGNGLPDILFGTVGSDEVAWLKQDPVGTFTQRTVDSDFDGTGVAAADVNGDGHLDVLGANSIDDTVSWWLSSGATTPTFTRADLNTAFDQAWDLKGADLDSDGDVDLYGCARGSGCLAWWENTDGAGTMSEHELGCYNSALLAQDWDYNRDGRLDLIQLVRRDDWQGWMSRPNRGGQIHVEGESIAPASLAPGSSAAVIRAGLTNLGMTNDYDAELKYLVMRFRGYVGGAWIYLDETQVSGLFSLLSVYQESDGVVGLDTATDTIVASVYPIQLDYMDWTEIMLASGDPNPAIEPGTEEVFYIVLQQRADAASQEVEAWRVEMEFDEYRHEKSVYYRWSEAPVVHYDGNWAIWSYAVVVEGAGILFADDFESGNTSAWSTTTGG